jgi:hypothetical protein
LNIENREFDFENATQMLKMVHKRGDDVASAGECIADPR